MSNSLTFRSCCEICCNCHKWWVHQTQYSMRRKFGLQRPPTPTNQMEQCDLEKKIVSVIWASKTANKRCVSNSIGGGRVNDSNGVCMFQGFAKTTRNPNWLNQAINRLIINLTNQRGLTLHDPGKTTNGQHLWLRILFTYTWNNHRVLEYRNNESLIRWFNI